MANRRKTKRVIKVSAHSRSVFERTIPLPLYRTTRAGRNLARAAFIYLSQCERHKVKPDPKLIAYITDLLTNAH